MIDGAPRTFPTTLATSALAFAALILAACQPPDGGGAGTAAVDTAAVLAGVDSLRSAYRQAVAEGDWQRLGGMVTEGAVMVTAGAAAWDSMHAASDAPFPEGATLQIEPVETRVLSPDWVYEMGRGAVTWTPEGADGPRTLRDTYLVILHRTADGWKVHREVASSRPLPEGGS